MSNGFAQAPLSVSVAVEPEREGNVLAYAPVAPKSADEKPMVMIAVMFRLTNNSSDTLHFQQARFSFTGPPFVADVLYTQDDVLGTSESKLIINPGQTKAIHFSRLVTIKFSAPAPPGVTIRIFFEESTLPVTVFRFLAPHVNPVEGGAYQLPFKAADLPPQAIYGGSSGHRGSNQRYGYDMGAAQWDPEEEQWRGLKPGETDNINENQVDWGLPVYAMADGEVLGFANDVPDNPNPPEKITGGGGNHFWIRHGTERVLYAHFMQGSLNPELLQMGTPVQKGQFLGRIGNSGSSTGAHLHIHAVRIADNVFQPLLFTGGYVVERALLTDGELSGPWSKLTGHALPFTRNAIWAAPFLPVKILRLGDSGNQRSTDAFQIAAVNPTDVVTAIRDDDGRLRVLSWSVPADGETISARGDSGDQAGAVNLILVASLGSGLVCTAITTREIGRLKLIVWRLDNGGATITRLGDSGEQAGSADALGMALLGAGQVATVVRTQEGRAKVILWQVSHDGQAVSRLGDTGNNGPAADLVAIATAGLGRFITAVRRDDGRLLVEVWESSPDGATIQRRSDSGEQAGQIGEIRVISLGRSQVVTAVRTTSERLKLIAWSITENGTVIRAGDSGEQAGRVKMIAVTRPEPEVLVTAVITNSGRLKLIAWHVSPDGEITRLGDSDQLAGKTNHMDCVALSPALLIAGARTESGHLKLINWSLGSVQAKAVASPFTFDLREAMPSAAEEQREDEDDFEAPPPATPPPS